MRKFLITTTLSLWGGAAFADAALLLGIERYAALDRVTDAAKMVDAEGDLAAVGFDVNALANGATQDIGQLMQDFVTASDGAERIIVGLAGAFITDGMRNWLMPVDAEAPGLFLLGGSVSVESVLSVMATAPGQAVLVMGYDTSDTGAYGPFVRAGIDGLEIPQGITVVAGRVSDAAELVQAMAVPGADLVALVESNRRLDMMGFAPTSLVIVPQDVTPVAPSPAPSPSQAEAAAETALWEGAQALDTADAYRNYLSRYPSGQFAAQAETLILEISTEPNRADRLAEEGLSLTREARRSIQRDLTILNFDPRGIDGIFGPGTRSAITNWQQQNGFSQTSFLTNEQITRLDGQASRRAAELEAEAERARAEKEQLDRAFWAETGAQGDEPGYRAYLERFPDGIFASQATEQLAEIENAKRQQAASEDRAAWDRAVGANTVEAYQSYLASFPQGAFIAEADARIAGLRAPEPSNDAAIAEENALGLDGITLRLIEARLAQIGLEPGDVDGGLDPDSRRAIRNFQGDRDLTVTGYLNEETIVRLLADGFSAFGR